MNMYMELLKEWCDRLLELQIRKEAEPELHGGILCPACGRIHGRCSDAMYPMLYLYQATGERKYKDCALGLFSWSGNMYHEEGFFYNDTNSAWKGITVFSAAQLGECLEDFGDCLEAEEREAVRGRFLKCVEYLREHIEEIGGNINYPLTCAYTMAVAHKATGEEKYGRKARQLAHSVKDYLTEEGLIFGEGKNRRETSPGGCRPVDIGYNVEESLPALIQYAVLEQDEEIYELVVKSMGVHLEFMLPDGAWDNSFGTRNYKWSYWGSRTSDGCAAGYGLTREPVFREAVRRNVLLLKKCTHNGLLYGGPMFTDAGEPPCVHHTFCHARGLAACLQKSEKDEGRPGTALIPSDLRDGIRYFPSLRTLLLGKGQWRATVTGYDVEYHKWGHPSGGAVSILWNEKLGPVFCGGMGNYELVEPNNMQLLRKSLPACLTPRIEYRADGRVYRNIYDKTAMIQWKEEVEAVYVNVEGKMISEEGKTGAGFFLEYEMRKDQFRMTAGCEAGGRLVLPVVSKEGDEVGIFADGRQIRFARDNGAAALLRGNKPFRVPWGEEEKIVREFSPVGGVQGVILELDMEEKERVDCEISMM